MEHIGNRTKDTWTLKSGSHVRRKHKHSARKSTCEPGQRKHKRKKKNSFPSSCACACVTPTFSCAMLMLASYVWTSLNSHTHKISFVLLLSACLIHWMVALTIHSSFEIPMIGKMPICALSVFHNDISSVYIISFVWNQTKEIQPSISSAANKYSFWLLVFWWNYHVHCYFAAMKNLRCNVPCF